MSLINVAAVVTERESILIEMDKSPFQFVLTGSRALGRPNENSDWDFYIAESNEVAEWLQLQGFSPTTTKYNDMLTRVVWQHKSGIDVQFVKDLKLKTIAQEMLGKADVLVYTSDSKTYNKNLWNLVISALKTDYRAA